MTEQEIVSGIDRSLAAIAAEREQLLAARAQLAGTSPAPVPSPARPRRAAARPGRRRRTSRGATTSVVLEALDSKQGRTATDVDKLTNVGRTVAGQTLVRLVKQGAAKKANRGYVKVAA
jgi:hypothetical protein